MSRLHPRARAVSVVAAGVLAASLGAAGCRAAATRSERPRAPSADRTDQPGPDQADAGPPVRSGVDEGAIDPAVAPCDDFYAFSCGAWERGFEIPDDEGIWYRSFHGLRAKNEDVLRALLEELASGKSFDEPYAKKLGDFYAGCMDEGGIERAGAHPIEPILKALGAVKDRRALAIAFAQLLKLGVSAPLSFASAQDFGDATRVIGQLDPAGLGLPERDYYVSSDATKRELRRKYEAHIASMFVLVGASARSAKESAAVALRVELALARASMRQEDTRDPKSVYHRLNRDGIERLAPEIPWSDYFAELGASEVADVNVSQPAFVGTVGRLVASLPIADWKTYLTWHVLRTFAPRLSSRFVDESFRMQALLTGTAKLPARSLRCVRATDESLGEALGRAFVKRTMGSQGKTRVADVLSSIEGAMSATLNRVPWMDGPTRTHAREKLIHVANMVAYPNTWRTYDDVTIDRGTYAGNVQRAGAIELARQLAQIGRPLDRTEWLMTPASVNAYYQPTMNQMVFPAGILQPPFFASERSAAVNFGALGMVMGHELTHGFDASGRQFDRYGNLRDWWSESASGEFEKRAACVEQQYSRYEIGDLRINGKLTLDENIADLGGLNLAYAAFKAAAGSARGPGGASRAYAAVDGAGWSPDQQFFLGFAQSWCAKARDESLRLAVATDTHSPARFRVNGPLSNSREFAAAFACAPGRTMVRPDAARCEVW